MATIATDVKWGSSPNIYFDFSYEKKREGSTQYYRITVSCDPITGSSYFGYPIYVQIYLDGKSKATHTLKAASPNRWTSAISHTTGWLSVSKTSGTTALAIRIYSGSGSSRDTTYNYTHPSLPPILYIINRISVSSYSKAPWGLSVLSQVPGIFTGTTISPSLLLRQCPNRYAFRAGRNLPDKEFRYLRTVIVTAAVYWGLSSLLRLP